MPPTPADHSFYFDPNDDPCPYCDTQMAGELNCQACCRERVPPEGYTVSSQHQSVSQTVHRGNPKV